MLTILSRCCVVLWTGFFFIQIVAESAAAFLFILMVYGGFLGLQLGQAKEHFKGERQRFPAQRIHRTTYADLAQSDERQRRPVHRSSEGAESEEHCAGLLHGSQTPASSLLNLSPFHPLNHCVQLRPWTRLTPSRCKMCAQSVREHASEARFRLQQRHKWHGAPGRRTPTNPQKRLGGEAVQRERCCGSSARIRAAQGV